MVVYFAYGSNMDPVQMARRVPAAESRGRARLPGYRFLCDKIGRDGSAKANIRIEPEQEVWGAAFDISEEDLLLLDRFERGYRRTLASIHLDLEGMVQCHVYLSSKTATDLLPNRAYRETMVRGARHHRLPLACIAALEALPVLR